MIEDATTPGATPRDAERRMILSYAPAAARDGLAALLALDDAFGRILRTTREPMVGQMRLTWWHAALVALDTAEPPAEPVLRALAASVLPAGVTGASLATLVDGWEALFGPLDADRLSGVADARGAALFGAMAVVLGASDPRVAAAGRGWALADLAGGLSDPGLAEIARAEARTALAQALIGRWPRSLRPLGAMALAARFDVDRPDLAPATPRRVARLLRHRITGG